MRQSGDIHGAVSTPSALPDPETLHFLDKIEGRSAEPLTLTEMFQQKDAVLARSARPRSCQHLQTRYAVRCWSIGFNGRTREGLRTQELHLETVHVLTFIQLSFSIWIAVYVWYRWTFCHNRFIICLSQLGLSASSQIWNINKKWFLHGSKTAVVLEELIFLWTYFF